MDRVRTVMDTREQIKNGTEMNPSPEPKVSY